MELTPGEVVDIITDAGLVAGEKYVPVNTSERAVVYWTELPVADEAPEVGDRPRIPLYPSQISDIEWTIVAGTKFYAWVQGNAGDGVLTLLRAT